jgi:gliding motility-associated-like protein
MTAPGRNAVRYTAYPSAPAVKDPVFIYCNSSGDVKGTLNAIRPKGSGFYDFQWYEWTDATKSFSISRKTDLAVTESTMGGLNEGGYKVDIKKGGVYDTSLVAWIFLDKPYASASLNNRTCDYVALKGDTLIDQFFYRNPSNGNQHKLPNVLKFLWTSNPASSIPYPDYYINPQTFDPPLVDVTYKLQVSDSFGCISESSFPYKSIHVKADFAAEPMKGGAPLEVAFTDKSIRATKKYIWEFGDKTKDGKKTPDWVVEEDSLWIFENPFPHIYYIPGEYSVKLTIESDLGCIDSVRIEPRIVVEPSSLGIPNVFTPNGDGFNDFFFVESKSLKYISVEIFSRSGLKVYSYFGEGESLRDWQGWDGNFNNSSIDCTPGVYFYIIRAYGWDSVNYDSEDYRGFVYLYR